MTQWSTLTRIEAPALAAVSLAEARQHLRLAGSVGDDTADDAAVQGALDAAIARFDGASGLLGRCLAPQSWRMTLDAFPCDARRLGDGAWFRPRNGIVIPLPPLRSIDAVKYIDSDGVQQTLASDAWQLSPGVPARLYPAYATAWPATRCQPDAVTIEFSAGYGDGASPESAAVPKPIVAAILLLAAHLYENREAVALNAAPAALPLGVDALTAPYRVVLP